MYESDIVMAASSSTDGKRDPPNIATSCDRMWSYTRLRSAAGGESRICRNCTYPTCRANHCKTRGPADWWGAPSALGKRAVVVALRQQVFPLSVCAPVAHHSLG